MCLSIRIFISCNNIFYHMWNQNNWLIKKTNCYILHLKSAFSNSILPTNQHFPSPISILPLPYFYCTGLKRRLLMVIGWEGKVSQTQCANLFRCNLQVETNSCATTSQNYKFSLAKLIIKSFIGSSKFVCTSALLSRGATRNKKWPLQVNYFIAPKSVETTYNNTKTWFKQHACSDLTVGTH